MWYWFLMGSPDIVLGFFILKIITQQYQFHAKKGSLSICGSYHHKILKMALLWNIDQKIACFTAETDSILILFK